MPNDTTDLSLAPIELRLRDGSTFTVSQCDALRVMSFGKVNRGLWGWMKTGRSKPKIARRIKKSNLIYLHRFIMEPIPEGHVVRFRTNDMSNCTRANLEVVPKAMALKDAYEKGLVNIAHGCQPKIVAQDPRSGRWHYRITFEGQRYRVGSFLTEDQALDARFAFVKKLRNSISIAQTQRL